MLDLERDPKLAWALRNRGLFPVDVNRAPRETLLRIPGIGARVAARILNARRHVTLRLDDLGRLVQSLEGVRPFVVTPDWRPTALIDSASLGKRRACSDTRQLDLFA
jgi:predicted DNA-binding helix-hairpin-helix protein